MAFKTFLDAISRAYPKTVGKELPKQKIAKDQPTPTVKKISPTDPRITLPAGDRLNMLITLAKELGGWEDLQGGYYNPGLYRDDYHNPGFYGGGSRAPSFQVPQLDRNPYLYPYQGASANSPLNLPPIFPGPQTFLDIPEYSAFQGRRQ